MAEFNRWRLSTMLTTNTNFKVWTGDTTTLDAHTDQLTNAFLIKNLERIVLQNAFVKINGQELACIVTWITKGHLGKVVCSEWEELSWFSNTVSNKGCTWNLDHGSNQEVDFFLAFSKNLCNGISYDFFLQLHFLKGTGKRYHNFRNSFYAFFLQVEGCFDNGASLHFWNLRISVSKTASTVTQHWVKLCQIVNFLLHSFYRNAHFFSHFKLICFFVRNKLM